MGWCHCRGRPKPWRVNFYSIKKKGFRQPTLAAIFSSSPLRNLTLPAWIDTKNVTNPSFALYRLNLRGRRNGNANFFSVNGEYKLRCENFFEFNSTPIRTGGGQISRVSSLSPIVVKFGINSPFQFNSIPILKWNIECWEHCILTLCCEIQ